MFVSRFVALSVILPGLIWATQVLGGQRNNEEELAGEMVEIPGGFFPMGPMGGVGYEWEKPVHTVKVPTFKIGKYEVTFAQWDACVADGGCGGYRPEDEGWGRDNRPVIHISWHDALKYIDWLNCKTGGDYRLPTEAEWEYAVRAGSVSIYHFGNDGSQLCRYANHADASTDYDWRNKACSDGVGVGTAMVGRYQPNDYGLHDMYGNVWEWVQDCWNESYEGAPIDGSAWWGGDCNRHVVRGGSWYLPYTMIRSTARGQESRSSRDPTGGFRLVQDK